MIICQIAAMSQNRVIGKNNALPWNLPKDLKFFREKTKGCPVIMGRRTFESVGHPLPNRENIVVTRNINFSANGATVVHSLEEAIAHLKSEQPGGSEKNFHHKKEVFIIGGQTLYEQGLHLTDRIYLTVIHKDFVGDTYFPEFSKQEFEEVSREDCPDDLLPHSYIVYERRHS